MKVFLLVAFALVVGVVPSIPLAAVALQAQRSDTQDTLLAAEQLAPAPQAKVLWTKGPRHIATQDRSSVRIISESEALQLMKRMRPD